MGLFSAVGDFIAKAKSSVSKTIIKIKKFISLIASPLAILSFSYISYLLYREYGPSADYDIESRKSAFLSMMTILIYCIYKYYVIAVIALKSRFEFWKTGKALAGLSLIFSMWVGIYLVAISMCLAFIPELTAWDMNVLNALVNWEHNPASIKFLGSLMNVNIFNASISIFVLLIISYFCYFGIVTSAILYARTNRFIMSFLGAPKFMLMNNGLYLYKLLPLTIFSFIFLCYDLYIGWTVSVFFVYLICSKLKGKKLI
ncbi:hypothetical protein [Pseudomonas putida]|uniref:hypothetical protein n=1 Tax=Pseudomonas putida TaxID=303 RepID=UPI000A56C226|nr:hypothetical protein [Pseudomonas putida]